MTKKKPISGDASITRMVPTMAEVQFGAGMTPEEVALIDAVCDAPNKNGADLAALHETLVLLHSAMTAVRIGELTREQVLAALRETITAMEGGEDSVVALGKHLTPILPERHVCL